MTFKTQEIKCQWEQNVEKLSDFEIAFTMWSRCMEKRFQGKKDGQELFIKLYLDIHRHVACKCFCYVKT